MTTFLLVRHAEHDLLGERLAGRLPGVPLNSAGLAQAQRLADRLAMLPVRAIYSSPLERALATAQPLANRLGLDVVVRSEFDEMDFGEWEGLSFEELSCDPRWRYFNEFRSGTRPPRGELMLDVQARIVARLGALREAHSGELVAVVTHGDVIKSALAHYLGVHLDLFQRIEVSPASVSLVDLHDYGPRVLCVNSLDDLGAFFS